MSKTPPLKKKFHNGFLDDCAFHVGKWTGDNSKYKSEEEPYDAYGMEWQWGLGNKSITKSELLPGKKVDFYFHQITWTKNEDGSVTQSWDMKSKEGKVLQDAFTGIYVRK